MTTHQIVSFQRRATKHSGSPMWACTTQDNEKVYVFQHGDPVKDTFHLFEQAGYGESLLEMALEAQQAWTEAPIAVDLVKEGDWWRVSKVQPRPVGAEPDALFEPDGSLWRKAVQQWADRFFTFIDDDDSPVYWDTETTGTGRSAEIISIGIVNWDGQPRWQSLIRPERRIHLTTEVHGITPEMLADAPTFEEAYDAFQYALGNRHWVIYNAAFDVRLLEQTCLRYGLPPLFSAGTHCAMEMFARWHGEWDMARQQFTSKSLAFAAESLGITNAKAHHALSDALTTWKVVRALADSTP